MSPSAASPEAAETGGALVLQRILALAGRNALARVELAASELDRLESSPAARERLGAIRSAVDELDGVLHEIERLASPPLDPVPAEGSPLARTWNRLVDRLAPTLDARGIGVERLGEGDEPLVALPALVLERILLAFLRLAIVSLESDGEGASATPLELAVAERAGPQVRELRLTAIRSGQSPRFDLAPAERVELEVALAQWRCGMIDETTQVPSRIGLRLRTVVSDD
jgi:hypothetical protein